MLLNYYERLFSDFHISMGFKLKWLTFLRWPNEYRQKLYQQESKLCCTHHYMQFRKYFWGKKGVLFLPLVWKRLRFAYKLTIYFSHCYPSSLYLICAHVNEFGWFCILLDYSYSMFKSVFFFLLSQWPLFLIILLFSSFFMWLVCFVCCFSCWKSEFSA